MSEMWLEFKLIHRIEYKYLKKHKISENPKKI